MKTVLFASVFALIPVTACSQAETDKAPATAEHAASSSSQVVSNADFATTNARLRAAIESRGLTLFNTIDHAAGCLLYTSPSPRDRTRSRMPSSA